MNGANINIRPANVDDLIALNRVVEAAVMSWYLPERVKRLALPSYRYNEMDLNYYSLAVIEEDEKIVAIAAWDREAHPGKQGSKGLLLHGIYVHPGHQRRGIGSRLFTEAENAARDLELDGVLVKAQNDAVEFFLAQGMQKLQAEDQQRDYENRYWKKLI
jgi:N-acetylglutamate synthase-like GNAT family acetyltransferase